MDKWKIIGALSHMGAILNRDTVLTLLDRYNATCTTAITDEQAIEFWNSQLCKEWKRASERVEKAR